VLIINKNILKKLKAISHEERLNILKTLIKEPTCVCELNKNSNYSQPNLSKHLKILKDADIIDYKKEGNKVIYFIIDKKIIEVLKILSI
jgi:ArsR family transcriptional regulator